MAAIAHRPGSPSPVGARLQATIAAVLLSLLLSAATTHAASRNSDGGFDYEWHDGRSTWYGRESDYWKIHDGHCYHTFLARNIKTGWDIAALSDKFPSVSGYGLCGRCFEVQCRNTWIKDGYGKSLDRTNLCYDEGASLVVQVTDKCPCYYPPNKSSNERWCCGDVPHMDLSKWAFEKLAPTVQGVMGIRYREVPCTHQPYRAAQLPSGQSPSPAAVEPPPNFDPWKDDPRPWP